MRTKVVKIPKGFEIDNRPAIADLNAIEDIIEQKVIASAVGSIATLISSEVPAGKIWIVTSITTYNDQGTTERIYLAKQKNALYYLLTSKVTLATRESVDFQNIVILNSGDKIRAVLIGCQGTTNTCHLYFNGYQISKY